MAAIVGYGAYIPRYRIKAEEINHAWGRSGGRGEKAVAAPDEDVLTMGVRAAQEALRRADLKSEELGVVYFASVSSGYAENTLAAQLGSLLGAGQDITVADFGLSTRSVTSALQACADAIEVGRVNWGLVVASDCLKAKPGSDYELSYAAGAGALVMSKEGWAHLEGLAACSSGFVGRSRLEGQFHGAVDERFVMQQGFLEHVGQASAQLAKAMKIPLEQFDHIVLQAPELRWATRAVANLKMDAKRLASLASQIGYAGCAAFLMDLAYALEKSNPGQRILAISYGPGGSDAWALRVDTPAKTIGAMRVEQQLQRKEYVNYPAYLRYNRLLGGSG
jgi:hydroxymethylglutaryl-CoA synthase